MGYYILPDIPKKYIAREGLEGPYQTTVGKVVYYDTKEGSYYDPDTDMYISYEDWKALMGSLSERYPDALNQLEILKKDYLGVNHG